MARSKTLTVIGIIEILIGIITLIGITFSVISGANAKTLNVLIFVILTSFLSTALGIGILKFNRTAYDLLIYFSSIIVLSKILIFADIITLNGALETSLPAPFKNAVSIMYHLFVVFWLSQKTTKKFFAK